MLAFASNKQINVSNICLQNNSFQLTLITGAVLGMLFDFPAEKLRKPLVAVEKTCRNHFIIITSVAI